MLIVAVQAWVLARKPQKTCVLKSMPQWRTEAFAMLVEETLPAERTAAAMRGIFEFINPMSEGCLRTLLACPPGLYIYQGHLVQLEAYLEPKDCAGSRVKVSYVHHPRMGEVTAQTTELLPLRAPSAATRSHDNLSQPCGL